MSFSQFQIPFGKSILVCFRLRVIIVYLMTICAFGVLITVYQRSYVSFRFGSEESLYKLGIERLEDILQAEIQPRPGRSIFFHETSFIGLQESVKWSMITLNARQACAVESAALHNPNTQVFVLFARPRYKFVNQTSSSKVGNEAILEALLSYENVYLRNLNLRTYAAQTPIYDWFRKGALFNSSFVVAHTSDFLRLLTLWRWGGTHLDMDTVMLRSMEDLPPNYAGAEAENSVNNAVMNFDSKGIGREIAFKCLQDFQQNFDGKVWAKNGPVVITRVMQHICGTQDIALMIDGKRCSGFKVYPTEAFYAISWDEWTDFFETDKLNQTMNRIKNSYLAHLWNNLSYKRSIKFDTKCAYSLMAEMHCPRVYKAAGLYF